MFDFLVWVRPLRPLQIHFPRRTFCRSLHLPLTLRLATFERISSCFFKRFLLTWRPFAKLNLHGWRLRPTLSGRNWPKKEMGMRGPEMQMQCNGNCRSLAEMAVHFPCAFSRLSNENSWRFSDGQRDHLNGFPRSRWPFWWTGSNAFAAIIFAFLSN